MKSNQKVKTQEWRYTVPSMAVWPLHKPRSNTTTKLHHTKSVKWTIKRVSLKGSRAGDHFHIQESLNTPQNNHYLLTLMQSQTPNSLSFSDKWKQVKRSSRNRASWKTSTYAIMSKSHDKGNEILEPQSAWSEVNNDLNVQFDFRRHGIKYLNGIL